LSSALPVAPPSDIRSGPADFRGRLCTLSARETQIRSHGEGPRPADPLYLFNCGLRWHQDGDAGAGWELIQQLRSPDSDARIVAAELLAQTEHGRVLARDLRRAKSKLRRQRNECTAPGEVPRREKATSMKVPYGMEIIEECSCCHLRRDHWFCGLSREVLALLEGVSQPATYPRGALLFVEGQTPRGTYMLCRGKVKLTTTSRDGKVLILKIAEAGEVLGLSAVISGQPFELTAETISPCHINFIERTALLERIEQNAELGLRSSQVLSREFQLAYRDIHDLLLARSSAGKLAKLLLSWVPQRERATIGAEVRIHSTLTHEEMAQMIGSSRETVTRLLGDLRKKELIRLDGATLVIRDRTALEDMAA